MNATAAEKRKYEREKEMTKKKCVKSTILPAEFEENT